MYDPACTTPLLSGVTMTEPSVLESTVISSLASSQTVGETPEVARRRTVSSIPAVAPAGTQTRTWYSFEAPGASVPVLGGEPASHTPSAFVSLAITTPVSGSMRSTRQPRSPVTVSA